VNAIVPINAAPSFNMSDLERMATAIAKGGLFGSNDPNAVLTLCLLAQAENKHPALIMQDFHIIQGKPAKKADAMLRDFVSAGGKVEWHTLDDTIADATFSHPYGGTVRIDWTMKRAQTAGLATPMWKKYPRQMLRSRVISEGVRTVYPGATSGLYETEEVKDIIAAEPPKPETELVQEAIEHTPEPEIEKRQPPLTGSIKTRAAVRAAVGVFLRDLAGCADADMLDVVLADNAALIEQVEEEAPFLWNGDGHDHKGLKLEIELAKVAFDDSWKTDMTRAG
jgi:hypothetical protein